MVDFSLDILVPVLNRPKNVKPFLTSFLEKSPLDRCKLFFITSQDCQEEINEINTFIGPITTLIAPPDVMSWAKRINYGINQTSSPWILCAADDVIFHDNWFEFAEKAAENYSGIIGTNDLGHPATISGSHTTHPIVSRDYVMNQGTMDEKGKFCHEGYIHNYVDAEFVHTAYKRGTWRHEPRCIIEHIHPSWNKASWDDVYQKGQDSTPHDRQLWVSRKQKFNL